MTIYAIVNNLITDITRPDSSPPVWAIISQSGILQGGNPYFVPDFARRFEARLALAIKIGRLGKGIAPRFAHRYVDAAAPCAIFVASDILQSLQQRGLPWISAISYDKCLAIGKFIPSSIADCNRAEIALTLETSDSSVEYIWKADSIKPGIEETLASISRDNTIKTGDILLMGIAGEGPALTPDLRATLSLNGTESLKFNIR
ncbi:MAG: fumarylacetoacetate hydrolase family protein [Muribaculaceae bacterium]|nr:fumarylacetoacetate hydrolase family protein [Muribaculaceae bacterium]